MGKKYILNTSDILNPKSDHHHESELKQKEGFFCSELVAVFLKYMGLMHKNEVS